MSRASKRTRVRITVTARFDEDEMGALVCRTRDVSETGLLIETPLLYDPGTSVRLSLMDEERGEVFEVDGVVTRNIARTPQAAAAVGIRLAGPTGEWKALVARLAARARDLTPTDMRKVRRLRILVVGDEARRRGALALYVQSGWDVRFASDLPGAEEALTGWKIDAVIAEHDLQDDRWPQILAAAKRAQPEARRIIRASLAGQSAPPAGQKDDLVHRVVDLNAGLEAVLDALTAEWSS